MAKQPIRGIDSRQDLGSMDAIQHNDASGAKKVMIVEPVIIRATAANENVGAGQLVKIAAAPYGLDMVGRAYNSANMYQQGDIVTNSTFVYMAMEDRITGTFDATKWQVVADKSITGIPSVVGNVVSTGRWHNAVTVAGFLVDDESSISLNSVRD